MRTSRVSNTNCVCLCVFVQHQNFEEQMQGMKTQLIQLSTLLRLLDLAFWNYLGTKHCDDTSPLLGTEPSDRKSSLLCGTAPGTIQRKTLLHLVLVVFDFCKKRLNVQIQS